MLIQILQKREGGSNVPLGHAERGDQRWWNFVPNDKGDHVCEVNDELDATYLLAMPASFVEYDPSPKVIVRNPAPAPVDPYAFLETLEGKALEDYAFEKLHAKLDESHDDAKRREYLRGVLKVKE
jgi:hypothetical protein